MSFERVKDILVSRGYEGEFLKHDVAHTCYDTAGYLSVPVGSIAKTMVIKGKTTPMMLIMAGDAKIDNAKFKAVFGYRPSFMPTQDAEELTGFKSGGVSPFGSQADLPIYIDNSLKIYETVYPACGTQTDSIAVSPQMLHQLAKAKGWVSVTKE